MIWMRSLIIAGVVLALISVYRLTQLSTDVNRIKGKVSAALQPSSTVSEAEFERAKAANPMAGAVYDATTDQLSWIGSNSHAILMLYALSPGAIGLLLIISGLIGLRIRRRVAAYAGESG